jgi:hypothetical protein
MSTNIAPVVDEPLTERQAQTLDKKIRAAADKSANNIHDLLNLMDQAATGLGYVALGYPSATAYFYDAVQIAPTDTAQRKLLAAIISDRRLTPKVIAEAFNSPPSVTA